MNNLNELNINEGVVTMPLGQYNALIHHIELIEERLHEEVDSTNEVNDVLAKVIDLCDREAEEVAKRHNDYHGNIYVDDLCKVIGYKLDEEKLHRIWEENHPNV